VAQLREICKARGVNCTGLTKPDLLRLLNIPATTAVQQPAAYAAETAAYAGQPRITVRELKALCDQKGLDCRGLRRADLLRILNMPADGAIPAYAAPSSYYAPVVPVADQSLAQLRAQCNSMSREQLVKAIMS
jgi:hypothetical protein